MRKIKEVIRLKFEADLSHERIAAATGVSKGAVTKYLGWVLGIVEKFDYVSAVPDDLVRHFPNLRRNESSTTFRAQTQLRSLDRLLAVADLGYCLHWGCRELALGGKSIPPQLASIELRRRAIEWSLSDEPWYEVALDT
jgi:hypothetical protein